MQSEFEPMEPGKCSSMADVRAGVDAVDARLVELLALRFGYMDAAARIKSTRDAVRDEDRKRQVISNVKTAAAAAGVPQQTVEQIWETLVEASIAYEFEAWDGLRA